MRTAAILAQPEIKLTYLSTHLVAKGHIKASDRYCMLGETKSQMLDMAHSDFVEIQSGN